MAVRLSALRTSRTTLPRNIIILMFLVLILLIITIIIINVYIWPSVVPWKLIKFLNFVNIRKDPLEGGSACRHAATYTQYNANIN
jgi:hypothetical protein